jgi:succinate dehydrogenase/fumarate reductase flavoprotein subunit
VADAAAVKKSGWSIEHGLEKGVIKSFDQLEALGAYYGMALRDLETAVGRFNRFVEGGVDEDFGKPILPGALPLSHPPYYAVRLWPKVHYTMGGVQIDPRARVIDLHQQPIAGLYAAGEVTGGVHGACRLGSCAITDCVVFGRIAGQNCAAENASA